ncbi:hypothetical protein M1466_02525 [Candidatus Dependentiae bacterium]|nr:hypothetical protein [Candidatus Dependentiae bacterium]
MRIALKKLSLIAFILFGFLSFKDGYGKYYSLVGSVVDPVEYNHCDSLGSAITGTSQTWSLTSNGDWRDGVKNNWMPVIVQSIKQKKCTHLYAPLNDLRKKMGLPAINF